MLSIKENFLETLKPNGHPDRLVNGFEFMKLIVPDPALRFTFTKTRIQPGATEIDAWGVTWTWPVGQPGPIPLHTKDNLVIKDIGDWENQLVIPDLVSAHLDWNDVKTRAAEIDRNEYLVCGFLISGFFERLHMLMGFEEALVNMMLEPEKVKNMFDAICEHRLIHVRMLVENIRPDIIMSHDDWGTKTSLFMPPDVWRDIIKPQYKKLYGYLKKQGVLVMHHADSFLEQIVPDMVDVGIDIWQGALPQNDIVSLQKQLNGRMLLMGGVDASIVDTSFATEDIIRAEVRRACETYGPHGRFIPSLTYGEPGRGIFPNVDAIISDEVSAHNRRAYGIDA